jgi:hypothetical protein
MSVSVRVRALRDFLGNSVLALAVKAPPAEMLLELVAWLCGQRQIALSSREVCMFLVDLVLEFKERYSSENTNFSDESM